MSRVSKGLLVLISGPSGVGKGTVIALLKKLHPDYVFPISMTTRTRRPGEVDYDVYHFTTRERFEQGIRDGEFLEWALVHKVDYYGTLKQPILSAIAEGRVVVREVDVQGFHLIRKIIPKEQLLTIFIKAPSIDDLISRIQHRGKLSEEELRRRMESAVSEMNDMQEFDVQVLNEKGGISNCVRAVDAAITTRLKQ